jgi:hypothetical protein
MDLLKLELRLDRRDVRARVADAAGEREVRIEGEPFRRVVESGKLLLIALEGRVGPLYGVVVDARARRILVAGASGGLRLGGEEYDRLAAEVQPLCRAVLVELRPAPPHVRNVESPEFWDALYRNGGDGWELARAAPPLERWFAAHPPAGKRTLVVGCGRGHEAALLASLGAQVTAIDFSPQAAAAARARGGFEVREQDLFTLGEEGFDLVVEHCCFCAVDPGRRDDYVRSMARALKDGGELVALFWAHGRGGGPPFSVDGDEIARRFEAKFRMTHGEVPRDSVAARAGQEILAVFVKP